MVQGIAPISGSGCSPHVVRSWSGGGIGRRTSIRSLPNSNPASHLFLRQRGELSGSHKPCRFESYPDHLFRPTTRMCPHALHAQGRRFKSCLSPSGGSSSVGRAWASNEATQGTSTRSDDSLPLGKHAVAYAPKMTPSRGTEWLPGVQPVPSRGYTREVVLRQHQEFMGPPRFRRGTRLEVGVAGSAPAPQRGGKS